MRRVAAVMILIAGILNVATVPANAGIADCVSMGYPSVSSTSTSIRVSVTISVNCSKSLLGTGGGPQYSIEGEGSFSSSCSGPYSLAPGTRGTVSCTINTGSSTGSSRFGATSSTLKIWFAYDFSTKFVNFSHTPIPGKSSTRGSAGVSAGGSAGGSAGVSTTLDCTQAPNTPVLIWLQLSDGIAFSASASSMGGRPTYLHYAFSYFDISKNSWDAWSSWTSNSGSSIISYKASTVKDKTKIAFAVYASNSCGSSRQARESTDEKGLFLIPAFDPKNSDVAAEIADALSASLDAINAAKIVISQFSSERTKCVASYKKLDISSLTKFSDFCLKLDNQYSSLYQKIYSFDNSKFITRDQADSGINTANAFAEEADILVVQIKDITSILVSASQKASASKKITITCVKGKLTNKVTAINPKCPTGYKVRK